MRDPSLLARLEAYASSGALPMHMPGHKGKSLPAPELAAIAAMAVVMSVLDCTAGILAAAVLFGVHVLSYLVQLSRLSQKF